MLPQIAIAQSVQDQEPPNGQGAASGFFGVTWRGPILSAPYGSKQLDQALRSYFRDQRNTLVQGAFSGLIKKVTSAPYEFTGKGSIETIVAILPDGNLVTRQIEAAQYFQDMAQNAHFGEGWRAAWSRVLLDYLTQNFGGVMELIGPGEPDQPMTGPVTGLAHLDALRCFATGNYEFPIIYYSKRTSKMHRMHRTRVHRIVDMPDPDEAMYGSGMCALYRAISIVQRELLMGRYVESSLDDQPRPGIMSVSGMTSGQREQVVAKYRQEQQGDERPEWGNVMWFHSIDPTTPVKVESVPWSQPPDKFDYINYVNLNINALALALGVDKQELWELGGGSLGSGAQSQVLSQKARGKAFGDLLSNVDRMINIAVLPDGVSFTFKNKDEEADKAQAEIDEKYMGIAERMRASGLFSDLEIRNLLADKSETFQKVLANQQGVIEANDQDQVQAAAEVTASAGLKPQTPATAPLSVKAYSRTVSEFETRFRNITTRANAGKIRRDQFDTFMLSVLNTAGKAAFLDGLKQGGVTELDDDDLSQVQRWLVKQIDYIDRLGNEIYATGLSEVQIAQRGGMWVNKSVEEMYNAGRISSDKNGLYEWTLNPAKENCPTCLRMNGQVHRLKEYFKRDLLPKSKKLECGGWECGCKLKRTKEAARGRF